MEALQNIVENPFFKQFSLDTPSQKETALLLPILVPSGKINVSKELGAFYQKFKSEKLGEFFPKRGLTKFSLALFSFNYLNIDFRILEISEKFSARYSQEFWRNAR